MQTPIRIHRIRSPPSVSTPARTRPTDLPLDKRACVLAARHRVPFGSKAQKANPALPYQSEPAQPQSLAPCNCHHASCMPPQHRTVEVTGPHTHTSTKETKSDKKEKP